MHPDVGYMLDVLEHSEEDPRLDKILNISDKDAFKLEVEMWLKDNPDKLNSDETRVLRDTHNWINW